MRHSLRAGSDSLGGIKKAKNKTKHQSRVNTTSHAFSQGLFIMSLRTRQTVTHPSAVGTRLQSQAKALQLSVARSDVQTDNRRKVMRVTYVIKICSLTNE